MKQEDSQLVADIRRGDASAFEALYKQHIRRIHNYAVSKLGNLNEAEDVTQEVFEAVFYGIEKFEGRSDLIVWIYGITRNVIHNRIRRMSRARFAPLEQAQDCALPEEQGPERQAQVRATLSRVRDVLEELPDDQRKILELRHESSLSIRKIASIMERSEDAVKSSLYRTRKALAVRLADQRI